MAKAAAEKPALPDNSFKLDGKTYQFVIARFNVPGFGDLTAKEALTEKEVLAYLVKEQSGVIAEVV